jgi:hypothetical protein
LLLLITC